MALAYFPDEERHRVVITASDEVRVDQLVALLDQQVRDGTWEWPVLYDASRRAQVLSTADVHIIASAARRCAEVHGRRGPVAIVRDTDVGFGVARMFGMLSADHTLALMVFRDRASAEAWLDTLPRRDPVGTAREGRVHLGERIRRRQSGAGSASPSRST